MHLATLRLLLAFDNLRQRCAAHAFTQHVEAHVAADAGREVGPVGLAQSAHEGVATLLANLAILVAAAIIQAAIVVLSYRN